MPSYLRPTYVSDSDHSPMPTPTLDQDIQSRIQSFLAELSGLVKRSALEAVQGALAVDGAVPRRRGRPARARAGRRVRRSAEDLAKIGARVLTQVRSKQGQRLEEIGRAMKTDTAILKKPIADLLAAKKLKTKGQKRGTQYFTK
jgi:hypothetical protein